MIYYCMRRSRKVNVRAGAALLFGSVIADDVPAAVKADAAVQAAYLGGYA